jgi:hypothetical protein
MDEVCSTRDVKYGYNRSARNSEELTYLGDLGVDGRIILKWEYELYSTGWGAVHWRELVIVVLNFE